MTQKRAFPASVNVAAHDQSQIEISIDYRPSQSTEFHTDFFFFLPRNFGVHSNSYSRDQFYNDLINHLRFHTPSGRPALQDELFALTKLLDGDSTTQERDLLSALAIQQIKLFANRANATLKRFHERVTCGEEQEHLINLIQPIRDLVLHVQTFRSKFVKAMKTCSLRIPLVSDFFEF